MDSMNPSSVSVIVEVDDTLEIVQETFALRYYLWSDCRLEALSNHFAVSV